jgi:hypothetical protein
MNVHLLALSLWLALFTFTPSVLPSLSYYYKSVLLAFCLPTTRTFIKTRHTEPGDSYPHAQLRPSRSLNLHSLCLRLISLLDQVSEAMTLHIM